MLSKSKKNDDMIIEIINNLVTDYKPDYENKIKPKLKENVFKEEKENQKKDDNS